MKHIIAIVSLALLSSVSNSQDTILQGFSATSIENTIQIAWTIKKGNTCQGIDILRSTDSLNFEEVGDIQGVCGSIEQTESYSFVDINPPKNQRIYYRLELGFNGLSEIIHIDHFELEEALLVFPNPAIDQITIIFQNSSQDRHQLSIFAINGQQIYQEQTTGRHFNVNVSNVHAGSYILQIKNLERPNEPSAIAHLNIVRT